MLFNVPPLMIKPDFVTAPALLIFSVPVLRVTDPPPADPPYVVVPFRLTSAPLTSTKRDPLLSTLRFPRVMALPPSRTSVLPKLPAVKEAIETGAVVALMMKFVGNDVAALDVEIAPRARP